MYWYVVTQSELQRGWTTHEKGSVFSWLWKDFLRSATHYGRLPGDKGLQYSLKAPEKRGSVLLFLLSATGAQET